MGHPPGQGHPVAVCVGFPYKPVLVFLAVTTFQSPARARCLLTPLLSPGWFFIGPCGFILLIFLLNLFRDNLGFFFNFYLLYLHFKWTIRFLFLLVLVTEPAFIAF